MTNLLTGLLGLLLATNQVEAASNLVKQTTGLAVEVAAPGDPLEKEYEALLVADDQAHAEIDKWIRDAHAFEEKGAGAPQATLNARIEQRQKEVKELYGNFLHRNPKRSRARVAYGSFLHDMGEEREGAEQWEMAREQDPGNPAVWNNLANYYGHRAPVKKAFEYYAKAIELSPREKVYYQNFATTVYLFRKDAMEYYNLSEAEVFNKALGLYRQAVALDPNDFVLYSDYAQSYYGTKPPRYEEGLQAWRKAYEIARDDVERQGVLVHIARCQINLGKLEEAGQVLSGVTNSMYLGLKARLEERLQTPGPEEKTAPAKKEEPSP